MNAKLAQKKNEDKFYKKGDFWIRVSLSILFLSIFFIVIFWCNGQLYFTKVNYVDDYRNFPFQVHIIDVEQGDSFLIKFPNNQVMLIDCGTQDEGENVVRYVKAFFKNEGLNKIDYLLLTHQDADHVGGATKVLSQINVENLIRPKVVTESESDLYPYYQVSQSQTYDTVINLAYQNECNIIFGEKGLEYDFDGAVVEFLSPSQNYYSASNDYSAVIMITCQTKKFLFMGDATKQIEQALIAEYGDYLKTDVLKVGHHGSSTSSSLEFLQIFQPEYAIISVREQSDFPSAQVSNNLNSLNIDILSTANLNNFAITIYNNQIVHAKAIFPSSELALLISIIIIALILTWGIKIKDNTNKNKQK